MFPRSAQIACWLLGATRPQYTILPDGSSAGLFVLSPAKTLLYVVPAGKPGAWLPVSATTGELTAIANAFSPADNTIGNINVTSPTALECTCGLQLLMLERS